MSDADVMRAAMDAEDAEARRMAEMWEKAIEVSLGRLELVLGLDLYQDVTPVTE